MQAESPQGKLVRRILLESDGPLTQLSAPDCLRLIQLKEGAPYDASAVKYSIERLYASQAFFDIQVQVDNAPDGQVDVTFRLARLYRVGHLRFRGRLQFDANRLRSLMPLGRDEAYSDRLVEQGIQQLEQFYRRNGYFQASFTKAFRLDEQNARLDIEIGVEAGLQARLASLEIRTQGLADDSGLLDPVRRRQGQSYSREALAKDLEDLQHELAFDGFLDAQAEISSEYYDPAANQVQAEVTVNAGPKRYLEIIGSKLSRSQMLQLPVYTLRSLSEALAGETEARLVEMHQEEGYFLAKASYRSGSGPQGEPGLVFEVEPGPKAKLTDIVLQGCSEVECEALRPAMRVQTSGIFSRGKYSTRLAQQDEETIRNYYQAEGFRHVQVDHQLQADETNAQRLTLVYRIEEGPRSQVRNLTISGNEAIDNADLRQQIASTPGEPFSPLRAAQDRRQVIAAYEDLGFRQADCRVEVTFAENEQVDLDFRIQEGEQTFIDGVVIVGDLSTHTPVIHQQLRVKAGDPLSLRNMLATETNLHNLSIFERVDLEAVETSDRPDARTVVIRLEEAPRLTFLYGIGYSSYEGPRGTVGLTDSNFRGRAQVMALGVRASETRQRGTLSWTVPRVHQLELPTVFSFTALNQDARTGTQGTTNTLQGRPFDELRFSFSARSERPLSRRESLFFGWRFERVEAAIPPGFEEDTVLEFFRQEPRLTLSSLELSYINESRDVASDPSKGFFLAGDASFSSRVLGSEEEFFRILLQGSYYYPLSGRLVLASALRVGWILPFGRTRSDDGTNPVPISERFFSGGSTSLRGFPQDSAGPLLQDENGNFVLVDNEGRQNPNGRPVALGGNALLIGNVELRAPLWKALSGTLFYDVGNVFENFSSIQLSDFSNTFGMGLRVRTPVGPLRFDAGFNPNPPDAPGFKHWLFHFSLGHAF